jgi:hypothetical protein
MGWITHDAVIVTAADYAWRNGTGTGLNAPNVDAFREQMPEELRPLLVGPIQAANGYRTFIFAPDGSKEGWDTSDAGDEWRRRFIDLWSEQYSDGSSPFDVVHIRYGRDWGREFGATIDYSSDSHADGPTR